VCLKAFDNGLKLPLKMFCGDTICKGCVSGMIQGDCLSCGVCGEDYLMALNSKGFLTFNGRYCRVKDKLGSLFAHSITKELVLRCIPLDTMRVPKVSPGVNIVMAESKPLDSDQLPVLTTQI
jgi:hypothetical protein